MTAAPALVRDRFADRLAAAIDVASSRHDLSPHERTIVAERIARELARRHRRSRYPSPGALAHTIDPLAPIETPALGLVDDALVRATVAMELGRGSRVAVAMPPQEGKSRRCTMAFPLWLLLRNPDLRVGIASFDSDVAATFSAEVRNWVVAYGSGTALNPRPLADDLLGISLRGDSTSKARFGIAGHVGGVVAVGMKGGLTGRPLDVLIVDDPYKDREQADSLEHRRKIWEWWTNVAVPRLPSAALVVLVQTRWHPDDLIGAVLAQERALPEHLRRWDFVNVPAQAERDRRDEDGRLLPGWLPDSLGRDPGVFLESARGRTPEDWALRRAEVGEMAWGSLYQQHPTPPEGAIFGAEHITRNRRPDGWIGHAARRAVAVDPSAGGADEAGIVAGFRGKDGRAYLTRDRSGRMTSAQWTRTAWLLVLDTDADDLVWETNLVAPTFRKEIAEAWGVIVAQARLLDDLLAEAPDLDRQAMLEEAAIRWLAGRQHLDRAEVEADPETTGQLAEVLDRIVSGRLSGRMETVPARLVEVHASVGKRTRATPVAVAVETNRVSHVGVFPVLELELTQWQEGQPSPGRLDAYVWLITHLLAVRRGRSFTAAGVTLPSASASR